jgi:hypothetical protein
MPASNEEHDLGDASKPEADPEARDAGIPEPHELTPDELTKARAKHDDRAMAHAQRP